MHTAAAREAPPDDAADENGMPTLVNCKSVSFPHAVRVKVDSTLMTEDMARDMCAQLHGILTTSAA